MTLLLPSRVHLSERLLLLLSRRPGTNDFLTGHEEWNLDNALSLLCAVFPGFLTCIIGKEILDFGCGTGWQSVALAKGGAAFVLGLENNTRTLEKAHRLVQEFGFSPTVKFAQVLDNRLQGRFDLVVSQNSMEHFVEPTQALEQMKSVLKPDGKIFITFGPPWYAPYGSHMHFFTKIPWVNLLFAEETVMKVRAHFRGDGAMRYEDVESGLNKMTVTKFEHTVSGAGLQMEYRRYDCVKRLNFLHKLPFLRELLVNQVSCVLTRR